MSLNIKNPETHQLAVKLAGLTGETLTGAITIALRERLKRVEKARNAEEIIAQVEAILAETGKIQPEMDHAELLYGKDGMPR
jgi:antitoxin VapB